MKVTINYDYEAEKQRIYSESLKAKQDEYNKIKFIDFPTIVIHIVMLILFIVSFSPSVYQNENGMVLRYASLVVLVISISLHTWLYKSNRNYYANLIDKHKKMTMDRYIEYIQNNESNIQWNDKWMIEDYEDLKNEFAKIKSLLNPDIISIEYAVANDNPDEISFFVTKKNNQKNVIKSEYVNILYRESEEDELVWDEDSVITLYTNNKDFVKQMKGKGV